MKGRKPRTPEQKAYITAQRNLIKVAGKLDNAEIEYNDAIQALRVAEASMSLDKLQEVQQMFPEDEYVGVQQTMFTNPTLTGNITNTPGNHTLTLHG